jgi:hypothetical protein
MPLDRGIIDQQLRALGESGSWWEQREMRDLPSILQADERILAIARGKLGRPRWVRRSWLIVTTDRRLICLRSGSRASWRQLEIPASEVVRVALRIGPFRGRVVVRAGGETYRVLVMRAGGYKLFAALSRLGAPARDNAPGLRPALMFRRVIDHVLSLPAVALNPLDNAAEPAPPPPDTFKTDERVQSVEDELEHLRQQVDFLEQLLHQQHVGAGADKKIGAG